MGVKIPIGAKITTQMKYPARGSAGLLIVQKLTSFFMMTMKIILEKFIMRWYWKTGI